MMPHIPCTQTCHEGTQGYWRYSSTHSLPWYSTEINGQPHVPADSSTGMEAGTNSMIPHSEHAPRHSDDWKGTQCIMGLLIYKYQMTVRETKGKHKRK